MIEHSSRHPDLEPLLHQHPLPEPPPGFPGRVLERLEDEPPPRSLWQHPALQWAAVALGLGLGLARLLSYVLGAWLALESAL